MAAIGELLRKRREELGAGLEEAARWCHTSRDELAQLENAQDLSSTTFERVCQGLAVSPSELLSGVERSPRRSAARFRGALSDARDLTPHDTRLLATASDIGRTLARLLDLLGRPNQFLEHRDMRAVSSIVDPWDQGYDLGEEARARTGPGPGPIPHLERWLSELSVHVARVRFSTADLEGASVWESGATPVILLNERAGRVDYNLSRRAILAHELCHLLHDGGEADIATRVSSTEGRGNYEEAIERRARAFAPAFLAPPEQVRTWAGEAHLAREPRAIVTEVARYWGLSYEGAIWHVKNIGLIEPATAEILAAERTLPDLPTDEFEAGEISFPPSMLNPELPDESSRLMDGWATKVIVEAVEASAISVGRAKELLAWR